MSVHYPVLDRIARPADVRELSLEECGRLAEELRAEIIRVTARNGGHVAPSLGVVELTLALLRAFDLERDKLIWDVGHQAYAYKLLTGRKDRFETLRQAGGISGFPKRSESPYDCFGVGHSSTSISAALGMAMARDVSGEKNHVAAIIGDGAMTGGLAFEALNHAGAAGSPLIVILNDNEMSISRNVGALSLFLSSNLSASWMKRVKRRIESILLSAPNIGEELFAVAKRGEQVFKGFFTPGLLFEAFNFNYVGPVNGHDIEEMGRVLEIAKQQTDPVLVHVLTHKGHGYAPAENNPSRFHGLGAFDPETGESLKAPGTLTYSGAFSRSLMERARADRRVVAITAAMPEGTGLDAFAQEFPERFVDVGICEQHAVTLAAGMAAQGLRPVVAIYSTFLQRAYDQIVHDVALQKLPVVFCVDRAGIVGEDGPTHHGAFDLSYLRHIPNLAVFAPRDEDELRDMLATALAHDGPVAIRYPRGSRKGTLAEREPAILPLGKMEELAEGTDLAVVAAGDAVWPAFEAAKIVGGELGKRIGVYNARFVKPLPEDDLLAIVRKCPRLLLVEENVLAGGFSSAVLEFLADRGVMKGLEARRAGLPDAFVAQGRQGDLRAELGLDASGLAAAMRAMLAPGSTDAQMEGTPGGAATGAQDG